MSDLAGAALQGKRILVTRTREQASVFSERLRALGAIPIEFPTIRIVPPHDWTDLDAALTRLYTSTSAQPIYNWLILTSTNGVHICMQRLQTLGYEPAALRNVRIATIGPATAAALQQYGLSADLVPDEYVAEGVLRALLTDARERQIPLEGQHILLARAAEARKILVTELRQAGALVDEVPAYTTVTVARDDEQGHKILQLLQQGQLDILTFTSSSTVRNFVIWLRNCAPDSDTAETWLETINQHALIASIGPITSRTAQELGLKVTIEAQEYTIDGLVQALVLYPLASK
jgi:uroporphyrinogen-III synthase